MAYGAFQEYYEREEYPNEEPSVISLVNGMCCLVSASSRFRQESVRLTILTVLDRLSG